MLCHLNSSSARKKRYFQEFSCTLVSEQKRGEVQKEPTTATGESLSWLTFNQGYWINNYPRIMIKKLRDTNRFLQPADQVRNQKLLEIMHYIDRNGRPNLTHPRLSHYVIKLGEPSFIRIIPKQFSLILVNPRQTRKTSVQLPLRLWRSQISSKLQVFSNPLSKEQSFRHLTGQVQQVKGWQWKRRHR